MNELFVETHELKTVVIYIYIYMILFLCTLYNIDIFIIFNPLFTSI